MYFSIGLNYNFTYYLLKIVICQLELLLIEFKFFFCFNNISGGFTSENLRRGFFFNFNFQKLMIRVDKQLNMFRKSV